MIIIPVFQNNSARYVIDIELANTLFKLKFNWNARESSWYMDIQDSEENDILIGLKLTINYRLLKQYRALENLPDGDFYLWDLKQNVNEGVLDFDNFGHRYPLLFFTNEEIETGNLNLEELSGI